MSWVTQGKHTFYTLSVPSDVLARTCFVSTRDTDPKEGFQRVLDTRRAEDIAAYIDSGLGTIPTAIVLSAQPEAELKIDRRRKTIEFKNHPKAFLILDGQHRVYGFSMAHTPLRVPVVIYNGLSRRDETRLFIDINTKQRPVPNELLLDIKNLAEYETDTDALLREVFDQFMTDPASPLVGKMSPSDRIRGKLSRVTFRSAFRPLMGTFLKACSSPQEPATSEIDRSLSRTIQRSFPHTRLCGCWARVLQPWTAGLHRPCMPLRSCTVLTMVYGCRQDYTNAPSLRPHPSCDVNGFHLGAGRTTLSGGRSLTQFKA